MSQVLLTWKKISTQTGLGWISILCSGNPPKLKKHPLKSPQCEWVYHIIIHIISISYIYIHTFSGISQSGWNNSHISNKGSTFFWPLQLPQELAALYDKQVFVLRRQIRPERSMQGRNPKQLYYHPYNHFFANHLFIPNCSLILVPNQGLVFL